MFSDLSKSISPVFRETVQTPSCVVYAIVDNPALEGGLSAKHKDYKKLETVSVDLRQKLEYNLKYYQEKLNANRA